MSTNNSDLETDGACASFGTNRDLFTLPDSSHLGECPICCLPLSIDEKKSAMMNCCCKLICIGCNFANQKREMEAGLEHRCAFCREPAPKSKEEADKQEMKRIKIKCPVAMCQVGKERYREGDYESAFEYWTKAAELGDATAHFQLSCVYRNGHGVEKDTKKYIHHLEEAAIRGDPYARHNLGVYELNDSRFDRARKHWIIAANLGYQNSLNELRDLYAIGHASKEDYADALRAYQTTVDATKSADREVAEALYEASEGRYERAVKHFIIAASFGSHASLQYLKELYANGNASKEEYADALHAYQDAVVAAKSSDMD